MTITELIELAQNRIAALEKTRAAAWSSGDVTGVAQADQQIAETQTTLAALQTLPPA